VTDSVVGIVGCGDKSGEGDLSIDSFELIEGTQRC